MVAEIAIPKAAVRALDELSMKALRSLMAAGMPARVPDSSASSNPVMTMGR
jgi:hypothetical protein